MYVHVSEIERLYSAFVSGSVTTYDDVLHARVGDLRDDLSPEFAREFYRALAVVHDDLFFSRYRRESDVTTTLSQQQGAYSFECTHVIGHVEICP